MHKKRERGIMVGPEISVCIPVVSGKYLSECLNSIFTNTFQDFEVIVNDSSKDPKVSDILKMYDLKIIKKETKSFESRYITALYSSGKKVFIFDETRLMSKDLLKKIMEIRKDMIVIKERDIGGGIVTFFSNLDKEAMPADTSILDPYKNKTVIPRVYRREIIMEALERIRGNLTEEILKNIVGLDIELIYLESYRISQSIGFIDTVEIMHYGDKGLRDTFRKYYRYGHSQKMLRNTIYKEFAGLSGRNRATLPLRNRIQSIPIQVMRGIPFVLGYISG